MNYENLLVERDDHVLTVTINRPEKHNALDPATHAELDHAFNTLEADPDLWIAILTGAGDRAFCAGGDISVMVNARTHDDYPIPESGYGGLAARFTCDKPIIAAVNGLAFGGGFEITLACDLAVASEHATFSLPEPRIGTAAVAGGMHRLIRQIGAKAAMELLLCADPIDARRALELGLVNRVVPQDQVMAEARALAARVLECAPLAVQATKHCVQKGLELGSARAAIEAQTAEQFEPLMTMMRSDDLREGMQAFMEKRKPQWRGR